MDINIEKYQRSQRGFNMERNTNLKMAIFKTGMTQRKLADEIGVHESVISGAISGRIVLTGEEKKKIAQALNKKIKELFD